MVWRPGDRWRSAARRWILIHVFRIYGLIYLSFGYERYCRGDTPVRCLKYFPKNDWLAKLRRVLISCIVIPVLRSNFFASITTYESIQSPAVRPLASFIMADRCLGLTKSRSA